MPSKESGKSQQNSAAVVTVLQCLRRARRGTLVVLALKGLFVSRRLEQ